MKGKIMQDHHPDQDNYSENNEGVSSGGFLSAAGSKLFSAWQSAACYIKPAMVFATGGIAAGFFSIHFYNNERDVVGLVFKSDEIKSSSLDRDTTLLTRGGVAAVVYRGISCPLVIDWPRETSLTLGNTGDATLTPSDDTVTSPISTILGSLGVTRDLQTNSKLSADAKILMQDFYAYANACNDKIVSLQTSEAQALTPQNPVPKNRAPE